jgi:polysaccharide biosynthesis protein PslG
MDTKIMQLPPCNVMPKSGDAKLYGLNMNPLDNRHNLECIGDLPKPTNVDVKKSIIGIGYETLDRDTFDPALTYKLMANTGVKWARLQTGWIKCEREKGVYNFQWLDETVDSLLAIGIQPWLSVSFGNHLYTPVDGYTDYAKKYPGEKVPSTVRGYVGEVPLYHGEEAIKGWENYLAAMVKHFKGRVNYWEIWNEPNTAPYGFWKTYNLYKDCDRSLYEKKCAEDYVELVKISSEQIRKANPNAKVIGGSITLALDACFFMRNLAEAGIAKYIDILTFHPYGANPELELETRYNNLRYELNSHGGSHVKIWQGETGMQTIPHEVIFAGTEYAQSKFITRRFTADFRIGCEMSSYFMVMDKLNYNEGSGEKICGFGVLDCKGNPKLSYHTLQSMGYLFDSAEKAEDLYIRINIHGTPMMSHLRNVSMTTNKFRRKGIPVFSYHIPENPEISLEPGLVDIQLWIDEKDKLENPVLIDPIRGKVYKIKEFESCKQGFKYPPVGFDENVQGFITLKGMPFVDYPLFISDMTIMNQ